MLKTGQMRYEELSQFAYQLPERLVADTPAVPRDSARVFVYNTQTNEIVHSRFDRVLEFLAPDTVVVLNTTKVLPARLSLNRVTGGKVEVLVLLNESTPDRIAALIKQDARNDEVLYLGTIPVVKVLSKSGPKYDIQWLHQDSIVDFMKQYGTTPLPPYIKTNTQNESQKRESYQSVFAEESARYHSVAAPTASLHFTDSLLTRLKTRHTVVEVELAIGMGTFGLLKPHHFETKSLHSEWVSMKHEQYEKLHHSTPVLAVGTTSIRTLESLPLLHHDSMGLSGWTDIFITPPHTFVYATQLLTNFHVSESSLMLLVEAFLQHKGADLRLVDLYKIAIQENYRFYSLGDAMLIV